MLAYLSSGEVANDPAEYERLVMHGARTRQKHQATLLAATDTVVRIPS